MERLLGGKLYKARTMTELALMEHDIHMDRNGGIGSKEKFDPAVCQCCGYRKPKGSLQECVCDGTEWYQLPDGRIECLPHKTARAIHGERRRFWDFGRRK